MVQLLSVLSLSAWLSPPIAADVPENDLHLYQDQLRCRAVDKDVAQATLNVLRCRMAYLRDRRIQPRV